MQVLTCQISRKSDQNCGHISRKSDQNRGHDSAFVFPTKMAVVTSSTMLMIQNLDNQKLLMIVMYSFIFIAWKYFDPNYSKKLIIFNVNDIWTLIQRSFGSNGLNMRIFMLSGSKSVRIDILFSDTRHFEY